MLMTKDILNYIFSKTEDDTIYVINREQEKYYHNVKTDNKSINDIFYEDLISNYFYYSYQFKRDIIYLSMAYLWASNSYCKRMKVGSLIVKNDMIISDGYNGMPSGFNNECEENNVTKNFVLHSEANALMKLARSTSSSENSKMYLTLSPCVECSKLIHQANIKKLYFSEVYRDVDGLYFLYEAGVELIYIPKEIIKDKMIEIISE